MARAADSPPLSLRAPRSSRNALFGTRCTLGEVTHAHRHNVHDRASAGSGAGERRRRGFCRFVQSPACLISITRQRRRRRGGRPANRVAAVMTADGSRAGMLLARGGRVRLMPLWCAWPPAVMTSSPPVRRSAGTGRRFLDPRRPYPVRAAWQPNPHDLCWRLVLGCTGSAMAAVPAWPGNRSFEH